MVDKCVFIGGKSCLFDFTRHFTLKRKVSFKSKPSFLITNIFTYRH